MCQVVRPEVIGVEIDVPEISLTAAIDVITGFTSMSSPAGDDAGVPEIASGIDITEASVFDITEASVCAKVVGSKVELGEKELGESSVSAETTWVLLCDDVLLTEARVPPEAIKPREVLRKICTVVATSNEPGKTCVVVAVSHEPCDARTYAFGNSNELSATSRGELNWFNKSPSEEEWEIPTEDACKLEVDMEESGAKNARGATSRGALDWFKSPSFVVVGAKSDDDLLEPGSATSRGELNRFNNSPSLEAGGAKNDDDLLEAGGATS